MRQYEVRIDKLTSSPWVWKRAGMKRRGRAHENTSTCTLHVDTLFASYAKSRLGSILLRHQVGCLICFFGVDTFFFVAVLNSLISPL